MGWEGVVEARQSLIWRWPSVLRNNAPFLVLMNTAGLCATFLTYIFIIPRYISLDRFRVTAWNDQLCDLLAWHFHVDGVRLRPSAGPLFIPQMIYEYGEPLWNDMDRSKLLIRPPDLWQFYQQSYLVENQEEHGEGIVKFTYEVLLSYFGRFFNFP
jgi:hypothetical protein